MYEDLNQIAQLRFNKERELISGLTRDRVKEMRNEYASMSGPGLRSGPAEASICQAQIDGAAQIVGAFFKIWIDLITDRNGYIPRNDVPFLAEKIRELANTQKVNLKTAFLSQRLGGVCNLMVQKADLQMNAVATNLIRDLNILAREHEAFPWKAHAGKEQRMNQPPKQRFSSGRRVLVGHQSRPGKIVSVDDQPSQMGEFRHIVRLDQDGQTIAVLGCDLQAFPELDADLNNPSPSVHLHLENSAVGNLNLGTQIGTINAAVETLSTRHGSDQQEMAVALTQLTEATIAEKALTDPERKEVVEALSTLAEQATKKPEEQAKGPIRAVVEWLPKAISAATSLAALWDKYGPIIKAHFGL